jgi:hypothetical protein
MMKKEIYYDICHEIARLRYDQENLSKRLSKRVNRKFQENIASDRIDHLIDLIYSIYEYTSGKLPQFTNPSTTGYADPEFVRTDELAADVKNQFPDMEMKVISDVIRWVIYWEYLR